MRVEGLFHSWEELREATDKKGHGLEEALSLMHFKRKIDNVQVLIGERVCYIHLVTRSYIYASEYGRLYS